MVADHTLLQLSGAVLLVHTDRATDVTHSTATPQAYFPSNSTPFTAFITSTCVSCCCWPCCTCRCPPQSGGGCKRIESSFLIRIPMRYACTTVAQQNHRQRTIHSRPIAGCCTSNSAELHSTPGMTHSMPSLLLRIHCEMCALLIRVAAAMWQNHCSWTHIILLHKLQQQRPVEGSTYC